MNYFSKIFKLALCITAISLFSNCSKDRIEEPPAEEPPPLNTYGSLDQFYDTYKQPEQEFEITQDGTGPIIGQMGTRLWVGKSIFMHQNGDSVEYPFTIKLIELYPPKDMILYRMPTVSSANLLTTGGEIRVRAFKGTEELLLRPNKTYYAQMPTTSPTVSMNMFFGSDNGTFVEWSNTTSNPALDSLSYLGIDSSNTFYELAIPKMGWINADYFYSYPGSKTNITFSSTTDDLTNVAKFLYFSSIRSVMQVYGNTSGNVPDGGSVNIICFARNSSGNMYYFNQVVTITTAQNINITLTATTESALISLLSGL